MKNNAFSSEPDYSISSATPVETAEELATFDKRMGGVSINKKTFRVFRFMGKFLGRLLTPKPDKTGVTVRDEPHIGRGVLIVQPEIQKGKGALFIIHGGG